MTTIITRQTGPYAKGSPLTNAELDTNFINLNINKLEANSITSLTANGINVVQPTSNTINLSLVATGVTPKTYGDASNIPSFTVDQFGRITAVSNTVVYIPPATSIVANSGQLTANASTGIVALGLPTTGVTAKTYGDGANVASFTVDAYGRITSVSNTAITVGASISDDTTTNSPYYPLFITSTSGTLSAVKVSSSKLNYNPSTGILTSNGFIGTVGTAYQNTITTMAGLTGFGTSGVITTASGDMIISGNLTVNGTTTTINANTVTTNDKNINLANNQTTSALIDGAGIDIGSNQLVTWRYNHATTSWQSNVAIMPTITNTLSLGGASNYWSNLYATNIYGTLQTASQPNITANVSTYDSVSTATTGTYYPVMVSAVSGTLINYANNAITFNVATSQLITSSANITSTTASTTNTSGALLVTGGLGVRDSVYVGNRVGFANTTQSFVYQVYNASLNSLDTIFG